MNGETFRRGAEFVLDGERYAMLDVGPVLKMLGNRPSWVTAYLPEKPYKAVRTLKSHQLPGELV